MSNIIHVRELGFCPFKLLILAEITKFTTKEETSFKVSIKTLIGIGFAMATIISMWFILQADIEEAKELPAPLPPDVTRMEYEMKDQLIRQTIMTTQDDVKEIKTQMLRMEDKIDKLK